MNILIILIPIALGLGLLFVISFFWANNQGQFDDLVTPAHKILIDDAEVLLENENSVVAKKHKEDKKI